MKLKASGLDIKDETQTIIPLCSLPLEYGIFVNSMIYGTTTIILVDVKVVLHNEVFIGKLAGNESGHGSKTLFFRGKTKTNPSKTVIDQSLEGSLRRGFVTHVGSLSIINMNVRN